MRYEEMPGGPINDLQQANDFAGSPRRRDPPTRPEFHQLRILLTVAELRSFTGAARCLGVSQPAISQAIARLEDIYGGDLFERRRGAKLELTPIAEAILPSARTLLDTVDQQLVTAAQAASSQYGTLTLGSSLPLCGRPLHDGIKAFLAGTPKVRLNLVEDRPARLLPHLHARAVDIAVLPVQSPLPDPTLVTEPLWADRLVIAMPTEHPLAHRPFLTWTDLAAAPLLVSTLDESGVHHALQSCAADIAASCKVHCVTRDTLLEMAAMGMGLAIVGESSTALRHPLLFSPIADQKAAIIVEAVWPSSDSNPLRYRLLQCLRKSSRSAQSGPLTLLYSATAPTGGHD